MWPLVHPCTGKRLLLPAALAFAIIVSAMLPLLYPTNVLRLHGWDGVGKYDFIAPPKSLWAATRASGIYYKTLYMGKSGENYTLALTRGKAYTTYDIPNGGSVTFSLPQTLTSVFSMNWAVLHVYVVPHVNAYVNPKLHMQLMDGTTAIGIRYVTVGSEGWYDLVFDFQYDFNQDIRLRLSVEQNLVGSSATIRFGGNQSSYDSYIRFETTTPISILSITTYDALDVEKTQFEFTDTLRVRAVVTSPFGTVDITTPTLDIQRLTTSEGVLKDAIMDLEAANQTNGSIRFVYEMNLGGMKGGAYQIKIDVRDVGTQHIYSTGNFTLPSTVSITPSEQGLEAEPGSKVVFHHNISTLADHDVVNLNISSTYNTSLRLYVDGCLALLDLNGDGNLTQTGDFMNDSLDWNGDGVVDTGPIYWDGGGVSITIVAVMPWLPLSTPLTLTLRASGTVTGDGAIVTDVVFPLPNGRFALTPMNISTAGGPGEVVVLRHTIRNTANAADTFIVTVEDLLGLGNITLSMEASGNVTSNTLVVGSEMSTPLTPSQGQINLSIYVHIPETSAFDVYKVVVLNVSSTNNASVFKVTYDQVRVGRLGLAYNNTVLSVYPGDEVTRRVTVLNYDTTPTTYQYNLQIRGNRSWAVFVYMDNGDMNLTEDDTLLARAIGIDGSMGGGWSYVDADYDQNGFPTISVTGGESVTLWCVFSVAPGSKGPVEFQFTVQSNYGDGVTAVFDFYVGARVSADLLPGGVKGFTAPASAILIAHELVNTGNMADVFNLRVKCDEPWAVMIYLDANGNGVLDPSDEHMATDTNSDGDFSDLQVGDFVNINYDSDDNDLPDLGSLPPLERVKLLFQIMVSDTGVVKGERVNIQIEVSTIFHGDVGHATDIIIIDSPPSIVVPNHVEVSLGECVEIDASNTADADGDWLVFRWYFNDPYSNMDVVFGPVGRYTYLCPGNYSAVLSVWDGFANVTAVVNVSVLNNGAKLPPIAKGRINTLYTSFVAMVGEWVYFDGSGSYDPDGGLVQCQWLISLLNGGETAALIGRAQSYRFTAPGVYNVTLKVVDDEGNVSYDTLRLLVLEDLGVRFSPYIEGGVGVVGEDVVIDLNISFNPPQSTLYEISASWWVGDEWGVVAEGEGIRAVFTPFRAGSYILNVRAEMNYGGVLCPIAMEYNFTVITTTNHAPVPVMNLAHPFNDPAVEEMLAPFAPTNGTSTSVYIPIVLNATACYDPDGEELEWTWELKNLNNPIYQYTLTGPLNEFEFPSPGMWEVKLNVSDGINSVSVGEGVEVLDNLPPVINLEIKDGNGTPMAYVNNTKTINLTQGTIYIDSSMSYDPDVRYGSRVVSVLETLWQVDDEWFSGVKVKYDVEGGSHNVTCIIFDGDTVSHLTFTIKVPPSLGVSIEPEHLVLDITDTSGGEFYMNFQVTAPLGVRPNINVLLPPNALNALSITAVINTTPTIIPNAHLYNATLHIALLPGAMNTTGIIHGSVRVEASGKEASADLSIYLFVHNVNVTLESRTSEDGMWVLHYRLLNLGLVDENIWIDGPQGVYVCDLNTTPVPMPLHLPKDEVRVLIVYIPVSNDIALTLNVSIVTMNGYTHCIYTHPLPAQKSRGGGSKVEGEGDTKWYYYGASVVVLALSVVVAFALRKAWNRKGAEGWGEMEGRGKREERDVGRGYSVIVGKAGGEGFKERPTRSLEQGINARRKQGSQSGRRGVGEWGGVKGRGHGSGKGRGVDGGGGKRKKGVKGGSTGLFILALLLFALSLFYTPPVAYADSEGGNGATKTGELKITINGAEEYNLTCTAGEVNVFYMDTSALDPMLTPTFLWLVEGGINRSVYSGQIAYMKFQPGEFTILALCIDGMHYYERWAHVKVMKNKSSDRTEVTLYAPDGSVLSPTHTHTQTSQGLQPSPTGEVLWVSVRNGNPYRAIYRINATLQGEMGGEMGSVMVSKPIYMLYPGEAVNVSVNVHNRTLTGAETLHLYLDVYALRGEAFDGISREAVLAHYIPLLSSMDHEEYNYNLDVSAPMPSDTTHRGYSGWAEDLLHNAPIITLALSILISAVLVYYGGRPYIESWDLARTLRQAREARSSKFMGERERLLPPLEIRPEEVEIISPEALEAEDVEREREPENFNTMISLGDMDVVMPGKRKQKKHGPGSKGG